MTMVYVSLPSNPIGLIRAVSIDIEKDPIELIRTLSVYREKDQMDLIRALHIDTENGPMGQIRTLSIEKETGIMGRKILICFRFIYIFMNILLFHPKVCHGGRVFGNEKHGYRYSSILFRSLRKI